MRQQVDKLPESVRRQGEEAVAVARKRPAVIAGVIAGVVALLVAVRVIKR